MFDLVNAAHSHETLCQNENRIDEVQSTIHSFDVAQCKRREISKWRSQTQSLSSKIVMKNCHDLYTYERTSSMGECINSWTGLLSIWTMRLRAYETCLHCTPMTPHHESLSSHHKWKSCLCTRPKMRQSYLTVMRILITQ